MALKTGDSAQEFSLFSTDKKEVKLSDYRGKNVVLLFFPGAFTGVCTNEMCGVRDNLSAYNNLNAEVIAISVDSLFANGKFKELNNLNFTVLSDYNRETCKAYGTLYPDGGFVFNMKGVSKRSAFVVDKNGIIRHAEILDVAGNLPDFEAIRKVLASLQ